MTESTPIQSANPFADALDRPFGDLMGLAWELHKQGRNGLTLRFDNPEEASICGVVEIRFHQRHANSDVGLPPFWEMANELLPKVLPVGWALIQRGDDGAVYAGPGMTVIVSAAVEADGRRWLHVSVARPNYLPTWNDLKLVKELFIGEDKPAIQVLPPRGEYVDIHPNCLHLWHCLDGHPLPDFTQGTGGI